MCEKEYGGDSKFLFSKCSISVVQILHLTHCTDSLSVDRLIVMVN